MVVSAYVCVCTECEKITEKKQKMREKPIYHKLRVKKFFFGFLLFFFIINFVSFSINFYFLEEKVNIFANLIITTTRREKVYYFNSVCPFSVVVRNAERGTSETQAGSHTTSLAKVVIGYYTHRKQLHNYYNSLLVIYCWLFFCTLIRKKVCLVLHLLVIIPPLTFKYFICFCKVF